MRDLIEKQAAIDVLSLGKEILSRVLDDMDVVGIEREKYLYGLKLIESNIKDIEELPSAQPENQVHLCDSCRHVYPECPSEKDDVIFGNGKGNDNICTCNKYESSVQSERKMCNLCKYYEGVHHVQGHAPCSFWKIGGVMYDDYCSRWEKFDE